MKRTLVFSTAFRRSARKIMKANPEVADVIKSALDRLEIDAFDPGLRTHKLLRGDLHDSWSCSLGYDLRIVFDFIQFQGAEAIHLLSIGTHKQVY